MTDKEAMDALSDEWISLCEDFVELEDQFQWELMEWFMEGHMKFDLIDRPDLIGLRQELIDIRIKIKGVYDRVEDAEPGLTIDIIKQLAASCDMSKAAQAFLDSLKTPEVES